MRRTAAAPPPWLLHQAVEQAAARFPDHPALWAANGGGSTETAAEETPWRYRELEQASRRAALELRAAAMPPGARLGVWMRKSPAAVAALLGALRAGGVYVPLDPAAPPRRVEKLASDCGLWGLYADAELAEAARAWARTPRLLSPPRRGAEPGGRLDPETTSRVTGDDLAYILYTSGSTGVPKGVMLSHAHALNFIQWAAAELELGPDDRVASHAPFHFDLSIFDLWATLSRGGEVCLLDGVTARFPRAVADWVRERGITVWYSVPSALVALAPHLEEVAAAGCGLRAVVFAGEVFPAPALRAWRGALPGTHFHNWYGPTETNVCAHYRLAPGATPDPLPLGRACPNFELAVLDRRGRPAAAGTVGDLWARGPGLLTGYWGDAARTAAVTRMRPGPDGRRQRWYNTGDQVRQGADGQLYFRGRRDDLVKCRGYRISLLEVAQALEACPGVRQAAVVAGEDVGGGTTLLAYVSGGDESAGLAPAALRRQLGDRLPPYMIPERIEVRTALPVTSTGKIDRQRLHPALPGPAPPPVNSVTKPAVSTASFATDSE